MKIGYDAKRLFTNFTGLGNYSRSLVSSYLHHYPEDQLTLFTPKIIADPRTQSFIGGTYEINQPKGFNPLWRTTDMVRDIHAAQLDVYHGLSHELPIGISKLNIGKVVTIHDLIFKYFPQDYSWTDRQIYDWKWKHACNSADIIVAISEQAKTDLIRYYSISPEKIKVIYQAADAVFSKHIKAEEIENVKKKYNLPDQYNLYTGSLISRKNLVSIIRAMLLMKESDRLPLVIIGNGKKYKHQVMAEATHGNIQHLLHWLGSPRFEDFPAIYKGAEMMIYPSFHEGFGLPVVEAMHTGIPVITSNQSSLLESGGGAAIGIDPSSPESLKEAILTVQSDDELRKQMVERGYQHMKKFEPLHLMKQWHDLYHQFG